MSHGCAETLQSLITCAVSTHFCPKCWKFQRFQRMKNARGSGKCRNSAILACELLTNVATRFISEFVMKTAIRLLWLVSIPMALVVILTPFGLAQTQPKEAPKQPSVMQRKLGHSQKVLEALAKKDFKELDAAASGLIDCVKDLTWKINETEMYLVYTNDFLRRAEGLKKAARDKNIDAAALTYVDMTLTCVKCHQYLRGDDVRTEPAKPLAAK